jgi:hypothetical protein
MPQIDFVVFGIPRSGTSVLVEAINTQPGIFCAHELGLALRDWPSRDAVIADVLSRSPSGTDSFRGRGREVLERKVAEGDVAVLGDKLPEYYLSLDEVTRRQPGIRKLCIYRSPVEFTESWDRLGKAGTPNGWPAGRVGLFGLFDLLILLHVLEGAGDDTAIVSHRALFHTSGDAFPEIIRFLGKAPLAVDEAPFRARYFARRRPMDLDAPDGPYAALIRQSGLRELDAKLERHGFLPAPDAAAFLDAALPLLSERLPPLFEATYRRLFAGRAEVAAYAAHWSESRRRLLGSHAGLGARLGAAFAPVRAALLSR